MTTRARWLVVMVLGVVMFRGFAAPAAERGPALDASTLVVGTRVEPKTLNPIAITAIEGHQIAGLLFQKLLEEQDDFMTFRPQLARSWSVSPDGLDITFVLRDDARWSDGKPVTANDVRFTWQVQTDTTVAWPSAGIKSRIRDVEVKDPKTVVFHFTEKYLYQLMDANDGVILPEHLLSRVARDRLKSAPFARAPVGNGAFVLKRWEPGQFLDLAANPRYAGVAPRVDRIIIKFVPDAVTLSSQLKAGEIDLLEAVPAADVPAIRERRDDVTILEVPSRRINFVAWNNQRAPFDERAVRRALTTAIDRQAIIQQVWDGYAIECTSPLVPLLWAFDPGIDPIAFDLDAARAELARLGYRDTNGDGILDRDGKPFAFELLVSDAQVRMDVATMVQAQLKKAGIKVDVRVTEYSACVDRILAMDYDAAVVEWKLSTKVDLTGLYHSSSMRPRGFNFVGYSNPELDRAIDEALVQPEMKTAKALWGRAQRMIYDDQPCTFIAVPQELTAVDNRFCNVRPSAISIFTHIVDWRIAPDCSP